MLGDAAAVVAGTIVELSKVAVVRGGVVVDRGHVARESTWKSALWFQRLRACEVGRSSRRSQGLASRAGSGHEFEVLVPRG